MTIAPTLIASAPLPNGRPPQMLVARRRWNDAAIPAAKLGHRMAQPEEDTGATLVGTCLRCEGLLAIDPCESPGAFGTVLDGPCTERIELP